MTRRLIIPALLLATLGLGCATDRSATADDRPIAPARVVVPGPATASLAFTPDVALDVEPLDLDRDGRRQFAYAGYESTIVSATYTRVDDRQRYNRFGDDSQYERRSISTTVTVRGQ